MALLQVNYASKVLGMDVEMNVILPQREGVFPVLYLLHGMTDDHTAWQRWTSIERYAEDYDLCIVMPTTHLGFYTNAVHGFDYFTFMTDELPKTIADMFKQVSSKREDTFIAGLSMGGYGALRCAFGKPEMYSYAASLSGAVDLVLLAGQAAAGAMDDDPFMLNLMTDILGDATNVAGSDNDLLHLARGIAPADRPHVFMWCGTEDFLYVPNQNMRNLLNELKYDLNYSESPGDHKWTYWDREIQNVLRWLPIAKRGGGR